jgi:futalosine hydrolase
MKILVVAATELELNYIEFTKQPDQFNLMKKVLGVGQIPTTYHLLQQIETNKPDLIIQTGIAGSFSKEISLGDVLAVEIEYMADLGVMENGSFQTIFDLSLIDENQQPFSKKQLKNPHEDLFEKSNLRKASSISVNEITTSSERIEYYKKEFSPILESMEGAAFHYCCLMKNIPFIQFRGVSNYIGERNKSNWQIDAALRAVAKSTQEFIYNFI